MMKQRIFYVVAAVFVILIICGYIWKDKSQVWLYHPNGKPQILVIEYEKGGHQWKKEVLFHPNGNKKSEGFYRDKMRQGKVTEWYWEGQKIYETFFDMDKPVGAHRAWFRNGALSSVQNYQNGQLHGEYRFWCMNGQVQIEGIYKEGKKQGRWITYTPQGKNHDKKRNMTPNKLVGPGTPVLFLSFMAGYFLNKFTLFI